MTLTPDARRPRSLVYGRKRRGHRRRENHEPTERKRAARPPKAIPARQRYLQEHYQPVDVQAFRLGFRECWQEAKGSMLGSWEAVLEGAGWAKPGDWRLLQSQIVAGSMDLSLNDGVLGRLLKNGGIKLLLLWKFHQPGTGDRWRAEFGRVEQNDHIKSMYQRLLNGDEDDPYAWEGYA